MNRDGVVSARLGVGIALSSSSSGHNTIMIRGGATRGDRMLAMCNFMASTHSSSTQMDDNDDKDTEVDAREVFGDRTHDPFDPRHPALHAANGFEALRAVAERAQRRFPDLKIFSAQAAASAATPVSGTSLLVRVHALREALRRVGCELGFLHDAESRALEPLWGVSAVDVGRYHQTNDAAAVMVESTDANGIEHRQQGTYLDEQGRAFRADDLWFPDQ